MMVNMRMLRAATVMMLATALAAPAHAQEARDWQQLSATLRPGSRVELHLKDGSHVDGTLVALDADRLVIAPRTRIPVAPWRVEYGEIRSLDVKHRDGLSPGAKVLVGFGVGAAAVFVGLLIAVASISD
jgi:hypothetical protein